MEFCRNTLCLNIENSKHKVKKWTFLLIIVQINWDKSYFRNEKKILCHTLVWHLYLWMSVCLTEFFNSHCKKVYLGLGDFSEISPAPYILMLVIWNFGGTLGSLCGYPGITLGVVRGHGTLESHLIYFWVCFEVTLESL